MSTYPSEAFDIHGGCNCSAIRYTLSFPPKAERAIMLSADKSNGQGDIRVPQTAICFCNDCRRASSGLVLFAIMVPFRQVRFSLQHKDGDGARRIEFGAEERLPPKRKADVGTTEVMEDTHLAMYHSSGKALRAFCNKCGTQFMYAVTVPLPPGATSGGLDFYLGTVDKGDLEGLAGIDRFVHVDDGMEWIKGLFVRKEGVPWHPGTSMAEF